MQPTLSLIVPVHNHSAGLPRLLDSIARQSMVRETEVLLVDDCSTDNPAGFVSLAASYGDKGLTIRLLRLEQRHYTKNARLAGIEASQGAVVGFADADDLLLGTDALERHARLLLEEKADVVHFRTALLNADGEFLRENIWTAPFARSLEGNAVFARLVNSTGHRSTLWSKLFAGELARSIVPAARTSGVRRYREDVLLTTYLLFHAGRYRASDLLGYGQHRVDKDREKAGGRACSSYYMLQQLVPYLKEQGCPPDVLSLYTRKLRRFMQKSLRQFLEQLYAEQHPCISDTALERLREHGDDASILNMLESALTEPPSKGLSRLHYCLKKISGALGVPPIRQGLFRVG